MELVVRVMVLLYFVVLSILEIDDFSGEMLENIVWLLVGATDVPIIELKDM